MSSRGASPPGGGTGAVGPLRCDQPLSAVHLQCTDAARRRDCQRQRLLTERPCHGVQVSEDGLSVAHQLAGPAGAVGGDASIQARYPLALHARVGYFEVTLQQCHPQSGGVVIGLADQNFPHNKQPGWRRHSCGFHSDGRKYLSDGIGQPYGPPFASGDTVGCGFRQRTREVWFTRNGEHLGVAFRLPELRTGAVYPTVGIERAAVSVNFGGDTFVWSPAEEEDAEREQLLAEAMRCRQPADSPNGGASAPDVGGLVMAYLLHNGYARAFAALSGAQQGRGSGLLLRRAPRDEPRISCGGGKGAREDEAGGDVAASHLPERRAITVSILGGDMGAAAAALRRHFPKLLPAQPQLRAVLAAQQLIEHVRRGELDEALEAAAAPDSLGPDGVPHPRVEAAMGLLAYSDPQASPLSHLLSQEQRMEVAETVNAEVLRHLGFDKVSALGALMRQLAAVPAFAAEHHIPV